MGGETPVRPVLVFFYKTTIPRPVKGRVQAPRGANKGSEVMQGAFPFVGYAKNP